MEFKALKNITKEQFVEICNNNDINTSLQLIGLHRATFTRYAKLLNCYNPNPGAKGIKRERNSSKFKIEEWNNNENINLCRSALRKWIFKLNLLPKKCNKCGLDKWLKQDIPLELNHINGNGFENKKLNLELLCPNCHALTETYRGKNIILKYGKSENKPYDKEKQKLYNKKPKKANKWHSFSRTKDQYLIELKQKSLDRQNKYITLINNSNINFTQRGWRLKLSKLLNLSPQHVGNFVRNNLSEIWEISYKHAPMAKQVNATFSKNV